MYKIENEEISLYFKHGNIDAIKVALDNGYYDIEHIINGLNYYKVITSNAVLTIHKDHLEIVNIYQDLTNGGK